MPTRRIVVTLSAVAAVLLGLEKVGIVELVPGGDVRFEWSTSVAPHTQAITMRSDAGDVTGWIEVVVPLDLQETGSYTAALVGGDPLAVTPTRQTATLLSLAISKAPAPPLGVPFTWRTGLPVVLTHTGARQQPLVLKDWLVHQSDRPRDSAGKAQWRRVWTVVSWMLLVLSIVGVALAAWTKEHEPSATPILLVQTIAASIEGQNPADTTKLRTFLELVLLRGVTVNEALDKLEIPARPVYLASAVPGTRDASFPSTYSDRQGRPGLVRCETAVTGAELEVVIARLESASSPARGTPTGTPDDDAWEALRVYLRQTAQRIVKRDDADDVVQTVLLKLQGPGALRRLRAAGSPRGYLAVMIRNAYVDLLRTRSDQAPVTDEPVDERPLPTELLVEAERKRRLASFTATLSEADRELLWLRVLARSVNRGDCRAPRDEVPDSRRPIVSDPGPPEIVAGLGCGPVALNY